MACTLHAIKLRMQVNANLLNQGVNTQSDPMNQSSSVDNAFTQAEAFPPLENYNSVVHVPTVHMGQPQNPYSPIGREYAQYNINNNEILSVDEIASDPSWKGRRSFGKGKNNGKRIPNFQKHWVIPELPTKESARTIPTGISIIPLFRNSEQPKALLSSHTKTSCNQIWYMHANQLDLSREASAQAIRSNRSASRKYDRAQTLDQRLIQVLSKTITRLLTPCG